MNKNQNSPKFYFCEICDYSTYSNSDFTKHKSTRKHKNMTIANTSAIPGNEKESKEISKYICSDCNYCTSIKTNYLNHLSTEKHKKNMNGKSKEIKYNCSHCDKEYFTYNALWKHNKKCNKTNKKESETETEQLLNTFTNDNDNNTQNFTPELFMELLKQSKELQEVLFEQNRELQNKLLEKEAELYNKLLEQNEEHHKQIIEFASRQISNTHINSHNTNNNTQFNLQFFLNETCKDAMNIADFVNSLQVQITDLEKTGKLGYVEGISGIFLRGLKELDYTMRPIHCTDLKRETVFVKDENAWKKDNDEKAKLKFAIQRVARKNLKTLPRWQEENPDFKILDTKENDAYMKIALNSLGGQTDEQQEKYVEKIMRNVLKEVVIEK